MERITDLFEIDEREFVIYRLSSEQSEKFINAFSEPFRGCLVSDDKIEKLLEDPEAPSRDQIIQAVLPDNPSIRSGDFGETLVFHLLFEGETKDVQGIIKWRWKEDKNKSAQKSDVVIFYLKNGSEGSPEDFILVAETKSKSAKRDSDPINDAVKGVYDDYVQRLAKTLVWAKDKYTLDGDFASAKNIDRFLSGASKLTYKRRFRATAVIDHSLEQDELAKPIDNLEFEDEFGVLVVSVADLSQLRNKVFEQAANT